MFVTDVESRVSTLLAKLNVNRSFGIYRAERGGLRMLADVRGNDPEPRPIVVELDPTSSATH